MHIKKVVILLSPIFFGFQLINTCMSKPLEVLSFVYLIHSHVLHFFEILHKMKKTCMKK